MDNFKLLVVKTLNDCISWTPKYADYFMGTKFFENPNFYFIFGKKSLETVQFIKNLYDIIPYRCLVLSHSNTFPKLVSNINKNDNKHITYWILGGKKCFSLFDKLVGEIVCINIHINSIPHTDELYYRLPLDNFEMTKIAQKSFDYYRKIVKYEMLTFKNKMTYFNGWISMENEYLKLSKHLVDNNYNPLTVFSEKITLDLSVDNFPILTTREIEPKLFSNEAISLYNLYCKHFQEEINHNQLVKNGNHLIQFFCDKIIDFYSIEQSDFVNENNNNKMPNIKNRYDENVSIQVYIPESKYFEQLPYDISVYSLFLILLCQKIKSQPKYVHLILGKIIFTQDTVNLVKEQIKRCPLPFPVLKLSINQMNGDSVSENENKNIKIDFDNYYHWCKLTNE
jgi:hypothetical protein